MYKRPIYTVYDIMKKNIACKIKLDFILLTVLYVTVLVKANDKKYLENIYFVLSSVYFCFSFQIYL